MSKSEQCRVVKYLVKRHFGALHLVGKSCGEVRIQHLPQDQFVPLTRQASPAQRPSVWCPSFHADSRGPAGAILTVRHDVPANPEYARSQAHERVRSRPVPSAFRQMTRASM